MPIWVSAPLTCGGIFDWDEKSRRLSEVNAELEDPAVWNDPKRAQALGKEKRSLEDVVLVIESLTSNLADNGELFFNEINTLPGSLAFYLWSAAPHHWTITELLSRLIDRAERLRATRRGLQRKPPPDLQLLG